MYRFFVLIFVFSVSLFASDYKANKIVSGLGIVWGFDFVDKDKIIVNEKNGNIYLVDLKKDTIKKIHSLNVHNRGQGGLLDVKVSPNFKNDNTVFFTYSKTIKNNGHTTLAKAKFLNEKISDFEDILITKTGTSTNYHYGSRITFDDKHVYFSLGDRGTRPNAQDLTNHIGTVIRLNFDGTIPKDNPFINDTNALDEIYSYGHRNAQGLFYDKKKSNLWLVEHGPRGGDEINLVLPKQNYGWPVVSRGKEYVSFSSVGVDSKEGMVDAKKYYIPSIAPSSLVLYRGQNYPNLDGKLLVGALKDRHINVLTLRNDIEVIKENRILEFLDERVRNIAISPDDKIYFSTDDGNIYLLEK